MVHDIPVPLYTLTVIQLYRGLREATGLYQQPLGITDWCIYNRGNPGLGGEGLG